MRQQIQLLLLIGLVVVLGVAGYRILFGSGPGQELVVVSAHQASATLDGTAIPDLVAGTVLYGDARVETRDGGNATLQYGDHAELVLADSTAIQVVSADQTGLRVEIDSGAVSARVRQGAAPLNISNRGRSVGATDADFTVMVGHNGPMSIASERGSVNLSGVNDRSTLGPDSAIHVGADNKATALPITESLLFEVDWPEKNKTKESTVEVTGTTDPYATVTLGSGRSAVSVRADRDGRFRADIPLLEGSNDIELKVRDVTGREATRRQALSRDSTAPVIESAEVVWGR